MGWRGGEKRIRPPFVAQDSNCRYRSTDGQEKYYIQEFLFKSSIFIYSLVACQNGSPYHGSTFSNYSKSESPTHSWANFDRISPHL